jgi:hypothetical protein
LKIKAVLLCIFCLLFCGSAFAQVQNEKAEAPKRVHIVGTLGLGYSLLWIDQWTVQNITTYYPWKPRPVFAGSIDLSMVSPGGFTLLTGDLMNFRPGYGLDNNLYFGAGYHYMAKRWDAGLGMAFSPLLPGDGRSDCLITAKLDFTWWFRPWFGLTAVTFAGASTRIGIRSAVFNQQVGVSLRD